MSANLDFLRAVAVLCVFFAHLYERLLQQHTLPSHHFGQPGVIIFFVHTSLVLMMSLDRSKLTGRPMFQEFFVHRFFRLYPLSIVCVLVAYLAPGSTWSVRELLTNLALTTNLTYDDVMVGGLWTLPLEVQMYVMLPFLFVCLRNRPISWVFALWLASIPIALIQPGISGRLQVLSYVPCFLGGVIAWRMGPRAALPGWLWPLGLMVAALPWMTSPGNQFAFRWITCLALGLAIPLFKEMPTSWLTSVSKTIAKYSYGIYLTHVAALTIAFGRMSHYPMYLQVCAFAVIAVILPLMAYHLIEHPMITFGKQLLTKPAPPPIVDGEVTVDEEMTIYAGPAR
jgi:peptidoglycan/LPS O-acetylase OafA/YrhL